MGILRVAAILGPSGGGHRGVDIDVTDPSRAPVLVMLAEEGEIAQVALVVIVVVAAGVPEWIPMIVIVRLAEEGQVGEVHLAVTVDVGADDHNICADDIHAEGHTEIRSEQVVFSSLPHSGGSPAYPAAGQVNEMKSAITRGLMMRNPIQGIFQRSGRKRGHSMRRPSYICPGDTGGHK